MPIAIEAIFDLCEDGDVTVSVIVYNYFYDCL